VTGDEAVVFCFMVLAFGERREAMILLVTVVDTPSKVLCYTGNSFLTVAERE